MNENADEHESAGVNQARVAAWVKLLSVRTTADAIEKIQEVANEFVETTTRIAAGRCGGRITREDVLQAAAHVMDLDNAVLVAAPDTDTPRKQPRQPATRASTPVE
jgi:hypothetical protein